MKNDEPVLVQKIGGDFINNNDSINIRCRIDNNLSLALKRIMEEQKISQQEIIERLVKEYVLSNITILLKDGKDK